MSLESLVFKVMKSPISLISFKARAVPQVGYQRFTN